MLLVSVVLRDANGGRPKELAAVTITNDGSASDGSGNSPFGNYDVRASWQYPDGRTRAAEARVEGFERRKSALALLQHALEAIAAAERDR